MPCDEVGDREPAQVERTGELVGVNRVERTDVGRVLHQVAKVVRAPPGGDLSGGSTPTRRRHQFAASFSAISAGRVSHMKARIGKASRVAEVSGWAMAQDFGAISPTTRCRNVTMISARTNPATSASQYYAPHVSTTGVIQWCTAGLVMAPSARVATGDAAGIRDRGATGLLDPARTDEPMDPDTVFGVANLTKVLAV